MAPLAPPWLRHWSDQIIMLYGAETWATTRGQEARLEVNEMRMLRWMCGVTRRDRPIRSEMNTLEGQ